LLVLRLLSLRTINVPLNSTTHVLEGKLATVSLQ
jgi:hypothetical protein